MQGVHGGRFVPGQLSQLQFTSVTVPVAKYARGVQWLADVTLRSVCDATRVGVSVGRVSGDAAEAMRDGGTVARAVMKARNRLFVC
jgi:hypothetical protein